MNANKTRFLRLNSLVAYLQSERDGDEVFIKYKGDKVAPVDATYYPMPTGPLELNIEIPLDPSQEWAELELWDHDILTSDDYLGTFRLKVDEVADGFTAELSAKQEPETRYVLNWGLIEKRPDATL